MMTDYCVRYIVTVLSVLFGAGAACGTADFMGESCYYTFPVTVVALLRDILYRT